MMNEQPAPVLDLTERPGPILSLEVSTLPDGIKDSGTPLALGIFSVLTLMCGLVLMPISKMGTGDPGETWSRILDELIAGFQGLPEMPEPVLPSVATAPDAEPAAGGDPFTNPQLSPLKGAYCMDYMPGGANPKAAAAFNQLVWSKLNKELQDIVDERLEVCMPFEKVNAEVVTAGGCAKSQCGVNDVNFYINQQGLIGVQYHVNGECQQASETGFAQTQLLCR